MILSSDRQAFVARELSADMDLGLYNQAIQMMQQQKYAPYYGNAENTVRTN